MRDFNQIIVATGNEGKLKEIKDILKEFDLEITSLKDHREIGEIKEDGFSFYENALIKAKAVYEITKVPTLADDSGLCVEFLDGMPGIFSARFAGSSQDTIGGNTDDDANNRKLLSLMKGLPFEERRAYFKCVMVFYFGGDSFISASGRFDGYIADEQRGEYGFGYDSVFYLPEYDKNSGELLPEEKNRISHRYKALVALKEKLKNI